MTTLVRRRGPVAAVAIGLALALAAVAFAAKPVKGARYSGHITGAAGTTVSFKVNKAGTKVTGVKATPFFPNGCGAGGPPPRYTSAPARIRHGKFSAKVTLITPTGSRLVQGTIRGTFLAHGKAKGTARPTSKLPKSCVKTFRFTAKARNRH
jgi:hypothetical protein